VVIMFFGTVFFGAEFRFDQLPLNASRQRVPVTRHG